MKFRIWHTVFLVFAGVLAYFGALVCRIKTCCFFLFSHTRNCWQVTFKRLPSCFLCFASECGCIPWDESGTGHRESNGRVWKCIRRCFCICRRIIRLIHDTCASIPAEQKQNHCLCAPWTHSLGEASLPAPPPSNGGRLCWEVANWVVRGRCGSWAASLNRLCFA